MLYIIIIKNYYGSQYNILYKAGQSEFSSRHKNKLHRIKTRKTISSTTTNPTNHFNFKEIATTFCTVLFSSVWDGVAWAANCSGVISRLSSSRMTGLIYIYTNDISQVRELSHILENENITLASLGNINNSVSRFVYKKRRTFLLKGFLKSAALVYKLIVLEYPMLSYK